jgi:hypothetical protein
MKSDEPPWSLAERERMTVFHLHCPYCNTDVLPPPGAAEGQRLPCPRCGESFVCRNLPEQPSANGAPAAAAPPPEPPRPTRANRIVGLAVLGGMVVMAAAGLTFAWLTVPQRRAHDFPKTTQDELTRVVLPADLAGLGYLPPDTALVAAVDVAGALDNPAGREFLDHFRPGDLLGRGREEGDGPLLPGLEQLVGVNLADLDHVVLGLTVEGRELLPAVTLVARARHPLEAKKDQIVAALHAGREPALPRARELYHFKLPQAQFDTFLWFADPSTVVVSLSRTDLDALPPRPAEGLARLTPGLREIIKTRVNAAAPQVWAAGHVEDWDKKAGQMLLAFLGKGPRQMLAKVRDCDGWLRFDPGLTAGADFRCADAAAARALEERLVPAGPRQPLRLLGGRPETAAVAEELARSLKASRGEGDVWVTLQAKAGPDTVRQALKPAR